MAAPQIVGDEPHQYCRAALSYADDCENGARGFPFAHHDSISRCGRESGACIIYPFTDGHVADFDPIFAELIKLSGDDPAILYRPDDLATPFLPVAQRLVARAEEVAAEVHSDAARNLFLRAAAVSRIARFPINRSSLSQQAWEEGKAAYEKGGLLLDPPSVPVVIAFTHAATFAEDRADEIRAYLRLPRGDRPADGWQVLLSSAAGRLPDRSHAAHSGACRARLCDAELRDSRYW